MVLFFSKDKQALGFCGDNWIFLVCLVLVMGSTEVVWVISDTMTRSHRITNKRVVIPFILAWFKPIFFLLMPEGMA